MSDRVTRIKELLAQKGEIDTELRELKNAIKAESASLRKPREKRGPTDEETQQYQEISQARDVEH